MVYFGLATDVDACLCVLRPLYPEATIELIKARYSLSELTGMRALLDEVTERADQAGGGYVTDESRQLRIAERYVRIGPSLARVITELPADALCIATQLQPEAWDPGSDPRSGGAHRYARGDRTSGSQRATPTPFEGRAGDPCC